MKAPKLATKIYVKKKLSVYFIIKIYELEF